MKQRAILAIVAVAMFCAPGTVWAMETEYLIAGFENTWYPFLPIAGGSFTSFDVTQGNFAAEWPLPSNGWQQGLRSDLAASSAFFPQMEAARKVRLDVNTSGLNIPFSGALQLSLIFQGQLYSGGPIFGATYAIQTITPAYGQGFTTVEWDLAHDGVGNPVPLPGHFDGGWFDMRINANVIGGVPSPGVLVIDNLRSAKGNASPWPSTNVLGDFNGDGLVDLADYTTWADHFNQPVADWLAYGSYLAVSGETINQAHYTTWAGPHPIPPEVPEPASLALLAVGAAAMLRRRQ